MTEQTARQHMFVARQFIKSVSVFQKKKKKKAKPNQSCGKRK